MIELIIIALGVVAVHQTASSIYVDYKMKKDRPNREAFYEALDRKHKYCCLEGNADKDIFEFIREVKAERNNEAITSNNKWLLSKDGNT